MDDDGAGDNLGLVQHQYLSGWNGMNVPLRNA